MEDLQDFLPTSYKYEVANFSKPYEQESQFNATIRVNLFSKANAESWLRDFESKNKVNFRVVRTYVHGQSRLVFKKDYRCHHNTRASLPSSKTKTPSSKHVNCQAFLRITVKKCGMKRSRDKLLNAYPGEITIRHCHNHLLECPDVLRYRKPTKETEEKILDLFSKGHSPTSALDSLKCDLQEEYGDEYHKIAADGAFCPNLQWVFHKYYTTIVKKFDLAPLPSLHLSEAENFSDDPPDSNLPSENLSDASNSDQIEDNDDERIISVTENLQKIFDKLMQEVNEDLEILEASEKFVQNFESIKTKSGLVSSLHRFGKQQLHSPRKINSIIVQPTSIARRKVYLRGRKHQYTGRPAKRHLIPEHGYSISRDSSRPQWLVPLKRRKISVPHSPSYYIEQRERESH